MTTPLRPDPALGLFETLLVLDGRPLELDAHLERLGASLEALFGAELPPGLADAVRERARGTDLGRLRITLAAGGGLEAELAIEDVDPADSFPAGERGAKLRSLPCPGGLGPHKWADRGLLAGTDDRAVPLLLDRGGEVLEAGRANVFAAVGETLFTPEADGRILPGIARAAAIEVARSAAVEVREERLPLEALLTADEVFLTGSVRGVEPARSLDTTALPAPGALSRLVGDGLRRRWLGLAADSAPAVPAGALPPGSLAR